MKNKITVGFLCFLTISGFVTVFAQETKVPAINAQEDPPFLITSFNQRGGDLKKPEYPKVAQDANVTGRVEIWIEVDENGAVTKARPLSGPDQLKEVCVAAALRSKFKPFEFQGKIFKSTGPIAFYFPESKEKEFVESIRMCLLAEWINSGVFGIPFMTESWLTEVDKIDPTVVKEVMESDSVKNGGQNMAIVLIDGVSARLETPMTGDKLWYFQFGKKMGKLEFALLTNGSETDIRARLTEIQEHSKTTPPSFPSLAASELNSLIRLLDKKELTSEEMKREFDEEASVMHQTLNGWIPRPVAQN